MKIASVYHSDHGVSEALMLWAVSQINPTGFFKTTLEIPSDMPALQNKLWGPSCGDASMSEESYIRVRDASDAFRPETPFVRREARPTHLLSIIGMADPEKGEVAIFTTYGGPLAERVPNDPHLPKGGDEEAASIHFWKHHALADI